MSKQSIKPSPETLSLRKKIIPVPEVIKILWDSGSKIEMEGRFKKAARER